MMPLAYCFHRALARTVLLLLWLWLPRLLWSLRWQWLWLLLLLRLWCCWRGACGARAQ